MKIRSTGCAGFVKRMTRLPLASYSHTDVLVPTAVWAAKLRKRDYKE